jgi:hypothetical protein
MDNQIIIIIIISMIGFPLASSFSFLLFFNLKIKVKG